MAENYISSSRLKNWRQLRIVFAQSENLESDWELYLLNLDFGSQLRTIFAQSLKFGISLQWTTIHIRILMIENQIYLRDLSFLKICVQEIYPFFFFFWKFVHEDLSFWGFVQKIFPFEDVFMEIYPLQIEGREIYPFLKICSWRFVLWRFVQEIFPFEDLFRRFFPLKICSRDFSFWRCIHRDLSIGNWSVGDLSLFKICPLRFV